MIKPPTLEETDMGDVIVQWYACYDNYRGWYARTADYFLITGHAESLEDLRAAVKRNLLSRMDKS